VIHKDPLIEHLVQRRQALGWSLKDLAQRCGIEAPLLLEWEQGAASPRLDAARRWSAALGSKLSLVAAAEAPRQGLRIDWDRGCVTVDGAPVRLTPMEWRGLERLARTPGELVSHETLYRHLYGEERPYQPQSTAIRVLITKLRRLLPLQIEARWGKGYVVSGFAASQSEPPADSGEFDAGGTVAEQAGELAQNLRAAFDANTAAHQPPSLQQSVDELSNGAMPRAAASGPGCRALPRTAELGAIERFLAERGVTRCPDVATIQQSPLPTLVWDKLKRKWVRPPMSDQAAG